MKIVCYFNKNLKMSEGKLAAQVGHVCKELARKVQYTLLAEEDPKKDVIVVLGLRNNKFQEKLKELREGVDNYMKIHYEQIDLGLTEVQEGTTTVVGYIEGVTIQKIYEN